jgi:hypothetical protein
VLVKPQKYPVGQNFSSPAPISPLRQKPLRNPGQSLDDELTRLFDDDVFGYLFFTGGIIVLALMEWCGYFLNVPRSPGLYTAAALVSVVVTFIQIRRIRARSARIRLGRDGERLVGQYLEELRSIGASILHDVPGDGFNLDHVLICDRGVVVVETKTWSKPRKGAKITFVGGELRVAGRKPRRDPVLQVRAEIRWLSNLLEQLTGETLPVRGALVFPGWWHDRAPTSISRDVWVLETKEVPGYIKQETLRLSPDQVSRATLHLSQYVRQRSGG